MGAPFTAKRPELKLINPNRVQFSLIGWYGYLLYPVLVVLSSPNIREMPILGEKGDEKGDEKGVPGEID